MILASLAIFLILIIGTAGYIWLEGWSLLDAFYATVITITTVGYGDFSPESENGRLFAIIFTLVAIGVAGYAISTLAAVVIENEKTRKARSMRKRRMDKIASLQGHTILCGGSILAHRTANELYRRDLPFIFIEEDEETLKWALLWMHPGYIEKRERYRKQLSDAAYLEEEEKSAAELADELGVLYLQANPTDEQQLHRAGIEKAVGIVAAMEDDRDNMAIVLSARDMAKRFGNDSLRIVARVNDEWNTRRLYLAGADKVISPNISGGIQIANAVLHPVVGEFWDHMLHRGKAVMRFVDVALHEHPEWVGRTVAEQKREQSQLVVAIKRDGKFIYAPDNHESFAEDDILIVLGTVK